MTFEQLVRLDSALASLSDGITVIAEGKPVTVARKMSATSRLKIARQIVAIRPHIDTFNKAKEEIIKQHGGPFQTADQAGFTDAIKEIGTLAGMEIEGFTPDLKLPISDFESEENPVDPRILADLLPYIG
jgi:hypothetical protein